MLVRTTWALVLAALGTLIGGLFTEDSNVLLFIAIGLGVCVILLLAVSWTRRAREASTDGVQDELAFAEETETAEEEAFTVGDGRRPQRTRRAAQGESKAGPARKSKATQAKKAAVARKAQTGGARKSKPAARDTTSKAKPPRRRASAQ